MAACRARAPTSCPSGRLGPVPPVYFGGLRTLQRDDTAAGMPPRRSVRCGDDWMSDALDGFVFVVREA